MGPRGKQKQARDKHSEVLTGTLQKKTLEDGGGGIMRRKKSLEKGKPLTETEIEETVI